MKISLLTMLILLICTVSTLSNGIAIIDAANQRYLTLTNSRVDVTVQNQVATVRSIQTFKNNLPQIVQVKYAFPLPADGTTIELLWKYNGNWKKATLREGPQDTTLPGTDGGGSMGGSQGQTTIEKYLGSNPLFYEIPADIYPDSTLSVSIKYVQLLKYDFGYVNLIVPNNYSTLQKAKLQSAEFYFTLLSKRKIDSVDFISHGPLQVSISNSSAYFAYYKLDYPANKDWEVRYKLDPTELGLFGMSTYNDKVPDSLGKGYMLFVAEPDPTQNTKAMTKYFTLIIDFSGSMSGTKMEQAKNSALFILDNLNQGDYFNIVKFSTEVYSFKPAHVPYNSANKAEAINYVKSLYATDMTNISGAFETALSQFKTYKEDSVNSKIILFFTDGVATAGITYNRDLIDYITDLNKDKLVTVYPFGVGDDVDKYLLTMIAEKNNGMADFLGNDEFQKKISEFYLKIRYPVLINPTVSFSPNIISEVYPTRLPNLYKGQQLMVTGRYGTTKYNSVTVKLSGTAFGNKVEYKYNLDLATVQDSSYAFLGKVWAKMKIESLLIEYYKYASYTSEAEMIKNIIIDISLKYGVQSIFTNYKDDQGGYYDMPVELVSFSGEAVNHRILLNWETASENNNYGFYVERKTLNGTDDWVQVGFVKGAGISKIKNHYQYSDFDIVNHHTYQYRLRQVDFAGVNYSESTSAIITITFTEDLQLRLEQNYPNPFKDNTNITFTLPDKGDVRLEIIDISGNLIKVISNGELEPGNYTYSWRGDNSLNQILPSGTYLVRLTAGNEVRTILLNLVR